MSRYFSWASVVGSECELSNTEIECALCALCKNRVALLFKPVEDRGRGEGGEGSWAQLEFNTHLNLGESLRHSSKSIVARIVSHSQDRHTHAQRGKHNYFWLNFTKTVFALLAFYTNRGAKKNLAAFSCCFCSKIDWLDDCRERERADSGRECP